MNIWKRFVNDRIINVILKAEKHSLYQSTRYLCPVIQRTSYSPFARMAIRKIEELIGANEPGQVSVLVCHLENCLERAGWSFSDRRAFGVMYWEHRRVFHMRYWELARAAIRKGHVGRFDVTPEMLQLSPTGTNEDGV